MTAPLSALHGRRLAVVDLEGNGRQPPEIVEVAVLPLDDGVIGERPATWLVRPAQPITPVVTRKVHGIRNADVADAPAWAEVADEVTAALAGRVLVAHNASVERRVLSAHLPGWKPAVVLDTLALAKHVWPGLASYRLDQLIAHVGLDDTTLAGRHHRAGYDAAMAAGLFIAAAAYAELDWPSLLLTCALPSPEQDRPQGGLW